MGNKNARGHSFSLFCPRLLSHPLPSSHGRQSPIAAIESDEPVASLLTLLASRRVLAAPVLIRSTGAPPGSAALARPGPAIKAVAGFVGAPDVLDALVAELGGGGKEGADVSSASPAAIEAAGEAVCGRPVGSLLAGAGATTATVGAVREATAGRDWGAAGAPASTPLLDALAFHFFKAGPAPTDPPPGRPVHRLAVFDAVASSGADNGTAPALTAILSQSDVVAALAASPLDAWGASANTPVDAVAPPHRAEPGVVSVPADTPALAAFAAMRAARVPGVAVTDPATGALVGHLSASDARCLAPGTFGALALPVRTFLAERPLLAAAATDTAGGAGAVAAAVEAATAAGVELVGGGYGRAARLLTAVPGLGLRPAAAALAAARVHQLYEVDGDGRPLRVVSASDVLAGILAAAGGAPA
jgi:CBS domain-containing protein